MSGPSEVVVFTIDIKSNNTELIALEKLLKESKDSMRALTKANAEGRLSNNDLAAATVRYKTEVGQITGQIKNLANASKQQEIANLAAAGSVDQLAARSKLLTAEFNKLPEAERNTSEAGKALTAELKRVNDALISAGKNVSDGRRSVGLYAEALKEAGVGAKDFKGGLSTAVGQGLSPFRAEIDRSTGLLGKFRSGTDLVKTGMSALKGGGETGALGFKAIAGGIALSGLGLLLIVLSTMLTYFSNTAEGGKLVKQALAGVGAVVTLLTSNVAAFGKAAVEAFSHPLDTIHKIGDAIKENLINRITAFGVIFEALKSGDTRKLADGFIQMGTGIANGTEKAQALAKGFKNVAEQAANAARSAAAIEKEAQRLVPVRRAVEKDEKEQTGRVEVLLRLSRDQNKSHQERKQVLQEAGAIEKKLAEDSIELQTRELVLLERKLALENGGKDTGQIKADIQEKELAIIDLKNNRESTYAKIRVRESGQDAAIRAEALADKKTKEAAAIQLQQDAVKKRITLTELALANEAAGTKKELALRQQLVQQQGELEAIGEKKTAADRALIRAKSLVEIEKLEDEFQQKQQDKARKFLDDQLRNDIAANAASKKREDDEQRDKDAQFKEQEQFLERHLSAMRVQLDKDHNEGRVSKKDYEAQLERLENSGFGARIVLAKLFGKDTAKLEEDQAKAHSVAVAKLTAEEKKAYAERTKAAQEFGSEVGSLFANTLEDTGASLQEFAGKVLVLILSSLEKATLAAVAEATIKSIGSNPTPAGIVQAALSAALITAAFESAKAVISTASAKPFAAGGRVIGEGTETSDSIPAVLSHNEHVLTAAEVRGLGGHENVETLRAAARAGQGVAPLTSRFSALNVGQIGGFGLVPGSNPHPVSVNDGGLLARQLGSSGTLDTAALVAALERADLRAEFDFSGFYKGKARHDRPRDLASLGGQSPSYF